MRTVSAKDELAKPVAGETMNLPLGRYIERYAIVLTAILLAGVFGILEPHFLTTSNVQNMAAVVPPTMLAAIGLSIPLASGDFDLSVGPQLGIAAAIVVQLNAVEHLNVVLAIVLTLITSAFIGLVNATFVIYGKLNALIATLATGTIVAGITLKILNNETVSGVSNGLQVFMLRNVIGIPVPFLGVIVIAALLWFVHQHTPTGRRLTMTGEGRQAAFLSGVRVDRIRFGAFVLAAVIYGLAGIVLVGQIGAADPTSGTSYTLPAFAAAFLGATTIQLGRFNVWGTVVAVCFVQIGVTGLALLGLQAWIVQVFQGAVLIAAVGFARIASSRSSLRRESQHQAVEGEPPATIDDNGSDVDKAQYPTAAR